MISKEDFIKSATVEIVDKKESSNLFNATTYKLRFTSPNCKDVWQQHIDIANELLDQLVEGSIRFNKFLDDFKEDFYIAAIKADMIE